MPDAISPPRPFRIWLLKPLLSRPSKKFETFSLKIQFNWIERWIELIGYANASPTRLPCRNETYQLQGTRANLHISWLINRRVQTDDSPIISVWNISSNYDAATVNRIGFFCLLHRSNHWLICISPTGGTWVLIAFVFNWFVLNAIS